MPATAKLCADCAEAPVVCKDRCASCYSKWRYWTFSEVREASKLRSRARKASGAYADPEAKQRRSEQTKSRRLKEKQLYGHRLDYLRVKSDPVLWQRHRQQSDESRINLRLEALVLYGMACVCCGEKETEFLAFDHVNGGGGEHRKTVNTWKFYKWLIETGEPRPEIRILCHNCNMATRYGKTCPHQR